MHPNQAVPDAAHFAPRAFGNDNSARSRKSGKTDKPVIQPPKLIWHGEGKIERKEIVKGLLPSGEVVLIAGQSGAGKTFVTLELAACIATGEPFFGHKIKETGGTLFLLAEGAGTIAERLEALRLGKFAEDSFAEAMPIVWASVPGALNDPSVEEATFKVAKAVSQEMRDRFGVELRIIVVDTLAAAFAIEDEQASGPATAAIKVLQRLHVATGALVLAVAHYGKVAEAGVRGSSAYTASADAILAVMADRDALTGKVGNRSIALTKSRWRETGWHCEFDLTGVRVGTDDDGDAIISAFVAPGQVSTDIVRTRRPQSKAVVILLQALRAIIADAGERRFPHGLDGVEVMAVPKESLRAEFYRRYSAEGQDEAKRSEAKRKSFSRAIEAATANQTLGFVESDSGAWIWKLE